MKKRINIGRIRLALQATMSCFYIYVGFKFILFLDWVRGISPVMEPRPGAVEGFLPISALLGFRQLMISGQWDMVHPAGLTLFLALLTMSFWVRKGFCGYLCPIGLLANITEWVGLRWHLALVPGRYIRHFLSVIKYGVLAFFLVTVFFVMDSRSVASFIGSPYNVIADAKMFHFFAAPSAFTIGTFLALLVFMLVVRNAWCRYLCPYGAWLGLFSWFSPTTVSRDETTCIVCGKCSHSCPSSIDVAQRKVIFSPECLGCGACLDACPVDGCLSFRFFGYRVPWWFVGIGSVAILCVFYGWAQLTGHWDADMPTAMYRRIYSMML